jgi:predicted aldo/keto reductase-like oxidoreductase
MTRDHDYWMVFINLLLLLLVSVMLLIVGRAMESRYQETVALTTRSIVATERLSEAQAALNARLTRWEAGILHLQTLPEAARWQAVMHRLERLEQP